MSVYPDEANPIRVLSEQETRRLSIASAQKATQEILKTNDKQIIFRNHTRIIIVLISIMCLTLIIANSLALNFTVICMFENENVNQGMSSNETDPIKHRLLYTDAQTSWLFSAIAMGSILGILPISYLTSRFGFRKTFMFYGLTSAISTILLPLAASGGFAFVLFIRIIEGISVASSFPALGSIVNEWSPLSRSGTYFAYLSTHLQLGTILTMPLAGELCESRLGWPSLYYFLGTTTLILFGLFFYFFRDSPSMHRNVSNRELRTLQKNKVIRVLEKGERAKVPYKAIFTDYSILGVLASSVGGALGFQLFFQYGPLYLNKILNFDIQNTGFAAAIPSVLSMAVKLVAGPLSDTIPYLSDKWRMIMFATISQFSMAFCFLALAFIPEGYPILAQVFYTGATVFSGLNAVGVSKSAQIISGSFAYFIMAILQFIASVVTLLLPLAVAVFVPENTRDEWARLFIFTGIFLIIVTMIFNFTAEGTPRPWTYSDQTTKMPSKIAPTANELTTSTQNFDIPEERLANLEEVDEILKQKRMSINGHRDSNLNLYEIPLGDSKKKDNPLNV